MGIERIAFEHPAKQTCIAATLSLQKSDATVTMYQEKSKKPITLCAQIIAWRPRQNILFFVIGEKKYKAKVIKEGRTFHLIFFGSTLSIATTKIATHNSKKKIHNREQSKTSLLSPLAGKVIRCEVTPNQKVKRDERLMVIESMKMENEIRAQHDGIIQAINASEGAMVQPNETLITFKVSL